MKQLYSYFCICLKKSFKRYVAIFTTTLLVITALFFVVQMIININQNDESRQRIKVGVVGDLSDSYMGISFSTLETIDDLGLSVKFIEMEENEAKNALIDSKISAYIFVPPNYISDLVQCKDVKLSFIMPKSAAASGVLMREIVKIVSPLVTEAESGILSMQDYCANIDTTKLQEHTLDLNIKYIDTILNRKDVIDLKTVGIKSLSLIEYYVCGIITFFLLLFSLSSCMIFSDKHLALGRLYCSKKGKPYQLVVCEYASYSAVMLVTLLLICTLCAFLPVTSSFGIAEILRGVAILTPCVLMIAAMHFFIYEITSGIITGILAQFISAVFMGYISGCFYPYYLFPVVVQKIASFLPSGIMFNTLRNYVTGFSTITSIIPCIIYIAVFITASSLIRQYRLRRDTL